MKKIFFPVLLLLIAKIATGQDYILKNETDHFSISQGTQGINIYGNDIKDALGNYFLKGNSVLFLKPDDTIGIHPKVISYTFFNTHRSVASNDRMDSLYNSIFSQNKTYSGQPTFANDAYFGKTVAFGNYGSGGAAFSISGLDGRPAINASKTDGTAIQLAFNASSGTWGYGTHNAEKRILTTDDLTSNDPNVIHNQSNSAQTADFWISGTGKVGSLRIPGTGSNYSYFSSSYVAMSDGNNNTLYSKDHIDYGNVDNNGFGQSIYPSHSLTASVTTELPAHNGVLATLSDIPHVSDVVFPGNTDAVSGGGVYTAINSGAIKNQAGSAQTADFWITGTGKVGYLQTGSAGLKVIGTGTNASVLTQSELVMGDGTNYTAYAKDKITYGNANNSGYAQYLTPSSALTAGVTTELPAHAGVLATLSDIPTLETTPYPGSTNGITSGGVYTAINTGVIKNQYNAAQTGDIWVSGGIQSNAGIAVLSANGVSALNVGRSDYSRLASVSIDGFTLTDGTPGYTQYKRSSILYGLNGYSQVIATQTLTNNSLLYLPTVANGTIAVRSDIHPYHKQTPSGTPNGSMTTFTLAYAPDAGSLSVFKNGVLQTEGTDYTVVPDYSISFTTAPATGAVLVATYTHAQ